MSGQKKVLSLDARHFFVLKKDLYFKAGTVGKSIGSECYPFWRFQTFFLVPLKASNQSVRLMTYFAQIKIPPLQKNF